MQPVSTRSDALSGPACDEMRRPLSLVLRIGLCMAVGLAGAAIALAAKGPSEGRTALGTARVDLEPSAGPGVVDAYVAIVDWGIRSRSFAAPSVSTSRCGLSTATR
jgi:hypothetical protein